jgi:hypothetical protein
MALLLTSVFGVTGCGSDDDVDVESRVKNYAPYKSDAERRQADCDLLDLDRELYDIRNLLDLRYLDDRDLLDLLDLLDGLYDLDDLISNLDDDSSLLDLLDGLYDLDDRRDLSDLLRLLDDFRNFLDQCDAASKSETKSPKGDDVDRG